MTEIDVDKAIDLKLEGYSWPAVAQKMGFNKVYVTEVLVENFSLLESKAVTEGRQQAPIGNVEQVQFGEVNDGDLPF